MKQLLLTLILITTFINTSQARWVEDIQVGTGASTSASTTGASAGISNVGSSSSGNPSGVEVASAILTKI